MLIILTILTLYYPQVLLIPTLQPIPNTKYVHGSRYHFPVISGLFLKLYSSMVDRVQLGKTCHAYY